MKAVICSALDGYEALKIADIARPEPGPGEVLIKVRAAALNFADSLIVKGKYQVKPALPFSPGLEASGEIAALGAGVTDLNLDQPVIAVLDHGGFAEYALAKASDVHPIPSGIDFITAASLPVAYGTSHHGLKVKAGLRAGEVLLVHGAAGGVGITAVEVGKRLGATVIATANGEAKLAIARAHGADYTIDSNCEDLREQVKELTGGRGADVIYDPIGGDLFKTSLRAIAPDGRILIIGFASGEVPSIPANILLVKNITCIGYNWGAYRSLDPQALRASFSELFSWLAGGDIKPHVSMTFALEDIHQAYEALLSRKSTGKVVIRVAD